MEEIELMNRIVKSAIDYGGDSGGPYLMNNEKLVSNLESWLNYKGYDNLYEVNDNGYCTIVPIQNEWKNIF